MKTKTQQMRYYFSLSLAAILKKATTSHSINLSFYYDTCRHT
ncbi:MAG: hypothetical protein ACI85I_001116 [Arenicella sp.]|jgi:hypothetical protein